MKTKLLSIAMMVAFIMTAMMKVQAQNFEGPCLPSMHGLNDHQSAFCGSTQTIALQSGVNWVSFCVETSLDDLKAALLGATGSQQAITIQSQTVNTTYNPSSHRWGGRLNTIDLSKMYKVSVAAACEITVEGMRIGLSTHPATIQNGANWIAFPLSESMTPTNAFAGFAVNGDKVQSQSSNANYNGSRWTGRLTTLEPGKGYIYQSNVSGPRTLVFPTSAK